jgi:hypothetical protein
MNVFVKIEFCINDGMAWHCIESLLARGEKPTKKKVIDLCRNHLTSEGGVFETEPQFYNHIIDVDPEKVDDIFNKTWK